MDAGRRRFLDEKGEYHEKNSPSSKQSNDCGGNYDGLRNIEYAPFLRFSSRRDTHTGVNPPAFLILGSSRQTKGHQRLDSYATW